MISKLSKHRISSKGNIKENILLKKLNIKEESTDNISLKLETILNSMEDIISRLKINFQVMNNLENELIEIFGDDARNFIKDLDEEAYDEDSEILEKLLDFVEKGYHEALNNYNKEYEEYENQYGEEAADEKFPDFDDTEYAKAYDLILKIENVKSKADSNLRDLRAEARKISTDYAKNND